MAKKQIDLGLTGLDELFMDDKERAESRLPKIHDIPLSEIDECPNHPFHVRLDEDMDQLVESIKERGIITPVTLRQKPDGRYEIVSGHRRTKACELAGLTTVKAEIKELSRDEAIILMVESNLQRTTILPSEKAFSYKMRLEAVKRQGQRTDLTSSPVGTKLERSSDELTSETGDSRNQIHRYIRLTHLIPPLLDLVDSGKIAFRPAVELSYLTEDEQNAGVTVEFFTDATCTDKAATWSQDSGKFTVTYSEDGRHMTVDIAKAGLDEINGSTANKNGKLYTGYSNYTARVTYSAVINSDNSFAYGEKGNENTVILSWKRTSGDYYDTLIDDCHVFSFGLDLTKLFSDVDAETAAETKLYDSVKFKIQNKTDGIWIIAKRNDAEGVYYVTGHTDKEGCVFCHRCRSDHLSGSVSGLADAAR